MTSEWRPNKSIRVSRTITPILQSETSGSTTLVPHFPSPEHMLFSPRVVFRASRLALTATMASMSDSLSTSGAIPALSSLTLAEFKLDTSGTIWSELLKLARQPGVCNLGQGMPDYAGSKVAREAASQAMIDPTMVRSLGVVPYRVPSTAYLRLPPATHDETLMFVVV